MPIDIYFTAVGIINIPTEEELIAAMEELRDKPLKSAWIKEKGIARVGYAFFLRKNCPLGYDPNGQLFKF